MIAYKLFRSTPQGITSLFANKNYIIPLQTWIECAPHPTKGLSLRTGWHCLPTPHAPHLSDKGRVWGIVEIKNYKEILRPKGQGGVWYLAEHLKVLDLVKVKGD